MTTTSPALATTPRDEALNGVFTTALEGGIGYWSRCTEYVWSDGAPNYNALKNFRAVIEVTEGGEGVDGEYVIDRAVIAKGIRLAYEWRGKGQDDYYAKALRDLQFGRYEDADFDSDVADWIVQLGLGLTWKGGPMFG